MSDKWNQLDVYSLQENRIRALYGHSVVNKIEKEEKKPPHILFHGTSRKSITKIMSEGLTSQTRQYVHLSVDIETAITVGRRRDHKPKILKVHASEAYNQGIKFYQGNDKVWLADFISPRYIIVD